MITWKGDQVADELKARAKRGVAEGANIVLAAAQPLTPHRDGLLLASLHALMPTDTGREILSGVATNVIYAAYQHELPETANFTKPGTGPKYLAKAKEQQEEAIAAAIRNYLKGVI